MKSNMKLELSTRDRMEKKIMKTGMLAKNSRKSSGRSGLNVQIGWTEGGDGAHHSEREKNGG